MSKVHSICYGPASPEGLPYSTFVRAGGFVYLAGLTGDNPDGVFPPGGITEEAHVLMQKAATILERASCSFSSLVKVTVSIRDEKDIAAFNVVYMEYVTHPHPARTMQCVTISADARVGLDIIALDPNPAR